MIDASGVDRPMGGPYCAEFKRTSKGVYALVKGMKIAPVWRFRDGINESIEIEHDSVEGIQLGDIHDFERFCLTDYRGLYRPKPENVWRHEQCGDTGEARLIDNLMGTLFIVMPIAAICWLIWQLL